MKHTKEELIIIQLCLRLVRKDDNVIFICRRIDNLIHNNAVDNKDIKLVRNYFKDNKPTPKLHKDFYLSEDFSYSEMAWWSEKNEKVRYNFLTVLIEQVDLEILVYDTKEEDTSTLIEKLNKVINKYPSAGKYIYKLFPEAIDNSPFIHKGDILLRKDYPHSLYVLLYNPNLNRFYINNIRDNRSWSGEQKATNYDEADTRRLYLSREDFRLLIKKSGIKLENVRVMYNEEIKSLHSRMLKGNKNR